MRTSARLYWLAAGAAVIAIVALSGGTPTAAHHQTGKYNSMNQMKTVEPCTAKTTLDKSADKSAATVGETITYKVSATNNASGSCLVGTTLTVVGTFVLENRSSASAGHDNNPCTPDGSASNETCVIAVLDWVETHTSGNGNTWDVLHANGVGSSTTRSGNPVSGQRNVDAYCPGDSSGPIPDLDGDGSPGGPTPNHTNPDVCSQDTQWQYGTLVTSLASPQPLPCGTSSNCQQAPQTYTYTLTVPLTAAQAAWVASCAPGAPTGSCDGIRNVVHFDIFNEQLTNSGRNHFARASFTGASLDPNAYNVTITDDPPGAAIVPADDSCGPVAVFTACNQAGDKWVTDAVTLAGGQTGAIIVKYKVRPEDCSLTITNTAEATFTDASGSTVTNVPPASAATKISTECGERWNSHSQGFWKSNGPTLYDVNADEQLDSGGVSIGGATRGKAVALNTEADTIFDGVGSPSAQEASCLLVVSNVWCTPLDPGVSRGDLTKVMAHTLALELNIKYLNGGGGLGATLDSFGEPNCTGASVASSLLTLSAAAAGVPPLPSSNPAVVTVGNVRATANGLINHSGTAGGTTTTSAQMSAMINVLGQCVNTNHAVVPGDRDWDGVPEDIDNCPGIYNPGQEDVDGDGIGDICDTEMDNDSRGVKVGGVEVFSDDAEYYMGTDWRRDCGLDAWPPDFNGDGIVDVFDVGAVKATFGTSAGEAAYNKRTDLNASGTITVGDLGIMKRFFNQICAGVDPIQPGAP